MNSTFSGLEVIAAEQTAALFRLFQLYYYENSDWAAEDLGDDGLYDACAASIADYVNDPAKGAYWIRQDGAVAGFVVTEPYCGHGGHRQSQEAQRLLRPRWMQWAESGVSVMQGRSCDGKV